MRGSRCGAASAIALLVGLACSGSKTPGPSAPTHPVASAAVPADAPVWPVRFRGTFSPDSPLLPNIVSPDGRWAVVTLLDQITEPEPTLFRLEPDGPVATLSTIAGTMVVFPEWLPDSRRLHLSLRGEPRDIDYRDATPALLDLTNLAVTREPKIPWDPTGEIQNPDAGCSAASPGDSLVLCEGAGAFVVGVRRARKIERRGPRFTCEGNRSAAFQPAGDALAVRCDKELVVARLGAGVVRMALDERARALSVIAWGNGGTRVALGGEPDCVRSGRCAHPGGPRVFDATTGRETASKDFRIDGSPWVITGHGMKLWADHRVEPLRRPLPAPAPFLKSVRATFHGETRVLFEAHVPPFRNNGDEVWREVELDLATARVISSKAAAPRVIRSPAEEAPPTALEWKPEESDGSDKPNARIVVNGRVLTTGRFVQRERGLVALRTETKRVELWTDAGQRLGLLPPDARVVPYLSPSGRLGFEPYGEVLRLIRIETGESLAVVLVSDGERTFGAVQSPSGWFAGDAEAFSALRFARGRTLLEAEPLTGVDVRASLERPSLLADFLAGRPVPLTPVGVLGRAP